MIRESFLEEEESGQELKGCGGWKETGGMEKGVLISGWWEGQGEEVSLADAIIVEGLSWPSMSLQLHAVWVSHGLCPTLLRQADHQASHRSRGCPIDWPVKGHLVGWLPRDGPRGQGWD